MPKIPRVLYLLPAEAFGGAERQGVLHIKRLPDYGFEIIPLVGPGEPILRELQRAGVSNYIYAKAFPGKTHSKLSRVGNVQYGMAYYAAYRRAARLVADVAEEQKVDLIFANRSFSWPLAAQSARRLNIPYVVRSGSRNTSRWADAGIKALCWRWGKPAAVVANCGVIEAQLAPLFGAPTHVVHNAVDLRRFDPSRVNPRYLKDLNLSDETFVLGLGARPAPEKGLELLGEVMRDLVARNLAIKLIVAGEFGWRAHYEQLFANLGLSAHVHFLGHVEDMPVFFASCDAVVLTSKARSIEALPNAVMEAMAMARPVVATDVGGVSELINDGVDGYLVTPDDPAHCADRIAALAEDAGLCKRIGIAARKRISADFSEEVILPKLAKVLTAALEGR